jgi:6-phosphogluconolactonase/glucosamine-6-phosphate isomerase/deaminase
MPADLLSFAVLDGQAPQSTTTAWCQKLRGYLSTHSIIALLGVGEDFHIAGIKPGYDFSTQEVATYYVASDFERITITPAFFRYIDHAILYAHGAMKEASIKELLHASDPQLAPEELIKDSKSAIVYYYP